MASQELLNKLFSALESSSLFQLMSSDERLAIREKYAKSSDVDIMDAMKALEEAEKMNADIDKEESEIQSQKVELVKDVKESMHVLKKVELQTEEDKDALATDKEAESLINGLNQGSSDKKKKFLGIF
ncbi:hypothetical protein IT413_02585 [Candidatus Peregrinibacteria bacterium]|nr:hypothetical protein [Candidatus Peregrinibacteria bacterium]